MGLAYANLCNEAKMKRIAVDFVLITFSYWDYSEEVLVCPARDERNFSRS